MLIALVKLAVCMAAVQPPPPPTGLAGAMQTYIDGVSAQWGDMGIGVGYVDGALDFGLGAGRRSEAASPTQLPGRFAPNSTVVLGSGTKPYTSAAVMRLVDAGLVALSDPAALHIDGPMGRMWNTSFRGLFGARADNVTVGQLLRMQSGLGDFDVDSYERRVLLNETASPGQMPHDPLEGLRYVANVECTRTAGVFPNVFGS